MFKKCLRLEEDKWLLKMTSSRKKKIFRKQKNNTFQFSVSGYSAAPVIEKTLQTSATEEIEIVSLAIAPDSSVDSNTAGVFFLTGLPSSDERST